MRLESQNKAIVQLKQKYDELKAMSAAKDELIARVENEMGEQLVFVDKTIKVLYGERKFKIIIYIKVASFLFCSSLSGPVLSPGREHCVVSWVRHLTVAVCLSTRV